MTRPSPFSGPITGPITGAKFFAIFASFFVVIIAVNFVMAYQAIRTFPGLVVANSYVASQSFDQERAAQKALGWTAHAAVHGGVLTLSITDAAGAPVQARALGGIFGRPTSTKADQTPEFTFDGTSYRARVDRGPETLTTGKWDFRLTAVSQDGTAFHQQLIVQVD